MQNEPQPVFGVGGEWEGMRLNVSAKFYEKYSLLGGFLDGSVVKNSPANAGEAGSIPGSGGSPGEGNGNPFQYSCLENPVDRGAWWATVQGVAELDRTERLSRNMSVVCWSVTNSNNHKSFCDSPS